MLADWASGMFFFKKITFFSVLTINLHTLKNAELEYFRNYCVISSDE
jgi:hypothetical protein